jgi:RNA polymerase sigma-70 factor (ECF subfamily)
VIGANFPAVLERARQRDERALEVIYRDLAPAVLGYVRGRGVADPEDVASEVFISLVRGLGSFEGDERAFRSWAFTIAHHRIVDARRAASRRPEEPADLPNLAIIAGGSAPVEQEVLFKVGEAETLAMLDALTEDQRAVVLLRILVGLSVAEVAAVLGKREGAVKTLQRRALARLATSISREPVS